MAKSTAVLQPNLGLFFNRGRAAVPPRGLIDGLNFAIRNGKLTNENLGWAAFGAFSALNGPVNLISRFELRSGAQQLIFGTPTDLYRYIAASDTVAFITPRYETGTASASGTAVTGAGTAWLANAKAGDEIHFGAAAQTDPEAVWFEIASVEANDGLTLTATAGTVGSGAYTIRKRFEGTVLNPWSWDIFYNTPSKDDLWIATNDGVDYPVSWNGSASQVTVLSALAFKAKHLAVFRNMMIYANLVTDAGDALPSSIINSDVGDPTDVTTGLSEQFLIHDGAAPIVRLQPLADNLAIYSQGFNITMGQFVGDPFIFIFRTAATGVGPFGANMVADFGDFHHFIGIDGQYAFDGMTLRETGEYVWRHILRQRDSTRPNMGFNVFLEELNELLWVVPLSTDTGGDPAPTNKAWAEHYQENTEHNEPSPFSVRQFAFTAAGKYEQTTTLTWDQLDTTAWQDKQVRWNDQQLLAAFPLTLVGDIDGNIWKYGTTQRGDGTLLPSFARFGRRALGDGRQRSLLTRVYAFAEAQPGGTLLVTAHLADHLDGDATISAEESFDLDLVEGGHFVSIYRRGRFVEVEFGTDGSPWTLSGYDLDVKPGGLR